MKINTSNAAEAGYCDECSAGRSRGVSLYDLPRTGVVEEREHAYIPEPGSLEDYNQQQYRLLKATGINCSNQQFAEWFSSIHGGLLVGEEGMLIDLGEVPREAIDRQLDLHWDLFLDSRYGPRTPHSGTSNR